MQSAQLTFSLADSAAERAFLESYMVDAWDRFEAHDAVDCAWFWRFGAASDHATVELEDGTLLEGGGVILVVNGAPDPTPALDAEEPHWEAQVEDGPLESYERKWFHPQYDSARAKSVENFGPEGGDLAYRMRPVASRVTLETLDALDGRVPPVGEASEENPVPVGYWAMIHYLLKQAGYDWYEEIDACRKAIENRLHSLEAFHGAETAREELDAVIDELEGVRAELGE